MWEKFIAIWDYKNKQNVRIEMIVLDIIKSRS